MRRLRELALTVGAVLGVACLLAALGAVAFDVRPVVFRSGSMSPTVPAGALALVRGVDAADISRGDVVGVTRPDGSRVTHRVVQASLEGGVARLRMKGDANDVVDPETYSVTSADLVLGAVPRLGSAVAWLTTGTGRLVLGAWGAFLAVVLLRPSPSTPEQPARGARVSPRRRATRRRVRPRVVGVFALLALAGSVQLAHPGAGWAAWTDQVPVSGTALGAHTVAAPASVTCSGGGLLASLTYSWPARDRRYTYRVELVDALGVVQSTRLVADSGLSSYSVTYAITEMPLGSFTVRVRSYLTGSTSWVSSTAASSGGSKASLSLGLTSSCGLL